jgi:glycine betaine/proline transport system substrate-binding protein
MVAVAAATLLLLAACGSDDDSSSGSSSAAATTAAPATTEAAMNMTPGDGVDVVAGRASWSTGYVQAEIFTALLRELGYTVSESADMELGPQNAFMAMAEGDMDFWANSWMPGHSSWLMGERTDGSLIGDAVTVLGMQIQAGGLQGFLIEKGFADEYGVYTLEDLDNNADAIAAYDATDANPGNGLVDIMGCPEDWTCDNIINSMLKGGGYKNLVQVKAGYDPMWAQATDMVNEGLPVVAYTWTPSAYITTIRPGDNSYWIGMEYILDDSNPNDQDGGEGWDQRPGTAAISEEMCPARSADGLCPIGWAAADIQAAANNDFLADNPAAEELFKQIVLSVMDVSVANVEQSAGADPKDLAAAWIADNRDKADAWLEAARSAG